MTIHRFKPRLHDGANTTAVNKPKRPEWSRQSYAVLIYAGMYYLCAFMAQDREQIAMNSFLLGAIIGIAAVGIIFLFWRTINKWLMQRDAFYKAQRVVHITDKTPAEIHQKAKAADSLLRLVKIGIAIGFWVGMYQFAPEFVLSVGLRVKQIIVGLIELSIYILESIAQVLRTS